MKTFKELLSKLRACSEAEKWAQDKTIEQVVEQCPRGDWLLWLAKKVDIGLQPLTLAKGHCANTVRHLMKDERSVKAVDTAIAFGEGRATQKDLNAAAYDADAAYAAAYDAADAAAHAAYDAATADAAYAAYAAAYDAAYDAATADAADAYAAYAAYAAADSADARKENQLQTANICRQYIGDLIVIKVNELLNTEEK